MNTSQRAYRLVIFAETYRRDIVEFSSPSAGCAILMAQRYRGDHPAELYQDGHWLGDLEGPRGVATDSLGNL
jgi:hypothetical protein